MTPNPNGRRPDNDCIVCGTLPPGDLVELDLLLADPLRWPSTIWRGFEPPAGSLPVSYRRFGQQEMGMLWLADNGYDAIAKSSLRRHMRFDVPVTEVDIDALVARGVIAKGTPGGAGRSALTTAPIDPLAYVGFYSAGIRLGLRGLELLEARVAALVDAGEDVPLPLINRIVDTGIKLSTSQAAIRAAGRHFGGDEGNEDDSFRTAGDPQQPSARFHHTRVRTIDGEATPVRDEGPADRARYNERAAQEGGEQLGGQR